MSLSSACWSTSHSTSHFLFSFLLIHLNTIHFTATLPPVLIYSYYGIQLFFNPYVLLFSSLAPSQRPFVLLLTLSLSSVWNSSIYCTLLLMVSLLVFQACMSNCLTTIQGPVHISSVAAALQFKFGLVQPALDLWLVINLTQPQLYGSGQFHLIYK